LLTLISTFPPETKENREQLGELYYLLAYSQFQSKQFRESIHSTKQSLQITDKKTEDLLQLQLNSYLTLKDYLSSQKVIKALISQNPNEKAYWQQWVSIAIQIDDTKAALSGLELIKEKYALGANETLHYAQLQLKEGSPHRAATTLEEALDKQTIANTGTNLRMLAYSWEQAGHIKKASKILSDEILTAKRKGLNQDTENIKLLIQLLTKQEEWHQIISLIETEIGDSMKAWFDHENPNSYDKAWLSLELGRALFHAGQDNTARKIFKAVGTYLEKTGSLEDTKKPFKALKLQSKQWTDYFKAIDETKR
jgi:hypothetical protein